MKNASILHLLPRVVARTPRHLGVNVEIQDHADQANVWDWLADSGVTVVREFHPEVSMRRASPPAGSWGPIASRADFDAWRRRVLADPAGPAIHWSDFRFAESIPWMGVPDHLAAKVRQLGLEPLYSLGYAPREFGRPLVRDLAFTGVPRDEHLDWEAAACAYEYYFAVIHHYATRFGGRYFMMINEPENRWGWFYLPPQFERLGKDWWARLNWDDNDPDSLGPLYNELVSTQYAALARLARLALEDVRTLLGPGPHADALKLSGPTNVVWEPFWSKAAPWLDICDVHHYHGDAAYFPPLYATVSAATARPADPAAEKPVAPPGPKAFAISEFNRYSGGVPIDHALWSLDNALQAARLLMTTLQLAGPDGPDLEFAAFYLLHFPSTHRNYKHLLYGDMNVVDWSGRDTPLWNRGPAWYPSFEELQIRFATPAYPMFRMLARCVAGGPHPVLASGLSNPTSADPKDLHGHVQTLVVRQPDRVLVTILNVTDRPAARLTLDLAALGLAPRFALVRQSIGRYADQLVTQQRLTGPTFTLDVPAQALVQVILGDWPLHEITALELREASITPGGIGGLKLWQTTRLRAWTTLAAQPADVTDLAVVWSSSHPQVVRADQGGLVQRLRRSGDAVTITARTLEGSASAQVVIPPEP